MKKMIQSAMVVSLFVGASAVMAESRSPEAGAEKPRMRMAPGMRVDTSHDQGGMLIRMLANQKLLTEAGVTAEQSEKLKADLKAIEIKKIDLDAELRKLSLEQTDLMARFIADQKSSSKTVMEMADKIGAVRTEQAKMQIKRLIAIRENLTPEQIAKIRELAQSKMKRVDMEGHPHMRDRGAYDGDQGEPRPMRRPPME